MYSLIELIDLFMKKNNPKEISKDERLKKEIVSINGILYDLISVCSGKVKIISEGKERVLFQQFLPLPSSVFDHYISKAANKPDQKGFYLFFK